MSDAAPDIRTLPVRVLRLEAVLQGITAGLMAGAGVFLATTWLVLEGGTIVGPHLALLGQFFVGYEVTFVGSLIGFAWGFVYGFTAGWGVSVVYNLVAARRAPAGDAG